MNFKFEMPKERLTGHHCLIAATKKAASSSDDLVVLVASPRGHVIYHRCSEKLILSWKDLYIK